ncbi:MAG: lipoate--protein ligase family protein [Candidatus Rokuibacteriota bacterium]
MTSRWRLLVTEPTDGATNMAIDEALWRGRQAGTSPPTLRFFGWAPPTVSLGYGQPLNADVDISACRALGVGVVRRPTGGSAIYHDGPERELTYSVSASAEDLGATADLLEIYRWIGAALLRGLKTLGAPAELVPVVATEGPIPAFCFARTGRYEIEIGGRKVVGSAQRRQGACFLQHGSILLGVDVPRLRTLFPTTLDPLERMTTLEIALGLRPAWSEVAARLAAAFEVEHGLTLKPDGLTAEELGRVEDLVRARYTTDGWLAGAT